MKQPVRIIGFERLENGEEKVSFFFENVGTKCSLVMKYKGHEKLICELVDKYREDKVFEFNDLDFVLRNKNEVIE